MALSSFSSSRISAASLVRSTLQSHLDDSGRVDMVGMTMKDNSMESVSGNRHEKGLVTYKQAKSTHRAVARPIPADAKCRDMTTAAAGL